MTNSGNSSTRKRPLIAFFDYPDVFEDFYPHYGVNQQEFATTWHNSANHSWIAIIQKEIGDVIWYVTSIHPEIREEIHQVTKCKVKFIKSSLMHRVLWRLFYLPPFAWRWRRFYRPYAVLASYLAPASWPVIKELYRNRPDAIFVQDYCSGRYDVLLLISRLFDIPLVTFHSGSTREHYLGKFLKRFTIPRADWIFPSGKHESHLLSDNFGFPIFKQSTIRPPIDITVYKPMDRDRACEAAQLDPKLRYFIFMGRLEDQVKRVTAIITAFSQIANQHPNLRLLIVGNGADEAHLKQIALEKAKDKVLFKGWVGSDAEKAFLLNASDCLLLASWREASPAVIGEAFSCGVPVASSNVGTISDVVIDNKSGWLFSAGNDDALVECMDYIAGNRQQVTLLKPGIRKIAEEYFSYGVITRELKKGFSSIGIDRID